VAVERNRLKTAAVRSRLMAYAAGFAGAPFFGFLQVFLMAEENAQSGRCTSFDRREFRMARERSQPLPRVGAVARSAFAIVDRAEDSLTALVFDMAALTGALLRPRQSIRIASADQDVREMGEPLAVRRVMTSLAPHWRDGFAGVVTLRAFDFKARMLRCQRAW
jgi:hypothetical protein